MTNLDARMRPGGIPPATKPSAAATPSTRCVHDTPLIGQEAREPAAGPAPGFRLGTAGIRPLGVPCPDGWDGGGGPTAVRTGGFTRINHGLDLQPFRGQNGCILSDTGKSVNDFPSVAQASRLSSSQRTEQTGGTPVLRHGPSQEDRGGRRRFCSFPSSRPPGWSPPLGVRQASRLSSGDDQETGGTPVVQRKQPSQTPYPDEMADRSARRATRIIPPRLRIALGGRCHACDRCPDLTINGGGCPGVVGRRTSNVPACFPRESI